MIFDFLFKKEVYCQYCGREIKGGFVAEQKVYCGKNNAFCLKEISKINPNVKFEYETAKTIQEDIKSKVITHYGKLEKRISE